MHREQTDRWESVTCSTYAFRRPSAAFGRLRPPSAAFATFPAAKLPSIAFYYNLGEIAPESTLTPNPHPLRPFVDLRLDLETCYKTFGDAGYYRDRTHCQ